MVKSYIFIILILTVVLAVAIPQPALAQQQAGGSFRLVPCGGTGQSQCTFRDLIVAMVRVINLLLAASAIVAMYYIISSSWALISALGNQEKITAGREGLTKAIVGFAIVLLSFAFINLLVQGIFGSSCTWWGDPKALWPAGGGASCLLP